MKTRTCIAAIGATALVGTGAFVLPALASASSPTHTLKFISVEKKSVNFTSKTGAQQDTDVSVKSKSKIVGFDELYFKLTSKTKATVNVTVDTTGGMLYGILSVNFTSLHIKGKVTGGTGAFKGATGTITATELNSAGSLTAVTIKYHG